MYTAPPLSAAINLNTRLPSQLIDPAIHLWLLDTQRLSLAQQREAQQLLSTDEQARAQRLQRGQAEFIASRWLVRKVLAHYSGQPAAALVFAKTDTGKPYLVSHGADAPSTPGNSDLNPDLNPDINLNFNLSHSGHWALLAVGRHAWLGVDIEAQGDTRDLLGIAENYFHPQEFNQLKQLDQQHQADYFYRLWTLKEAFFKATGTGIVAGLEKAHFDVRQMPISAQFAPELTIPAPHWQFHQHPLGDQCQWALAYASHSPVTIHGFSANDCF